MKHTIEELRGFALAHWTAAIVLALGPMSCASPYAPRGADDPGSSGTADLAAEVDALTAELTERASLRIPLGSARVLVEVPIAVRLHRNRHWPEHWWAEQQRAAQATLEFELEVALANRMNVVGARHHARASESPAGLARAALAVRAEHADATHALHTTYLHEGLELELTVQLVALDTGWIVASARRRISGFSPEAYDAPLGPTMTTAMAARTAASATTAEPAPVARRAEPSAVPAAANAAPDVRRVTPPLERAAPVAAASPDGRSAIPSDELVPLEAVEGPAALRRKALERIATEVAARVGEGPNAP